jgi:Ca2+/Na+ antiporter
MKTNSSRWVVPAFGVVIGLIVAAVALARNATPLEAAVSFAIVAGYALGLRLLQARSETASLLSGLPVDERWAAINQRALSVAAQAMASILLAAFLLAQFTGGDWKPYAFLGAAFAVSYFGAIVWYRWRQ